MASGNNSVSREMPANSFEWNGTNSTAYGIVMLNPPAIITPKERYSSVAIPGRSGSLTITENKHVYDNYQLSCTCIILNTENISSIALWLTGNGVIRFSKNSNRFYKARIANQISFDKILRGNEHRTFTIQFDCEPFVYIGDPENTITYDILSNGGVYGEITPQGQAIAYFHVDRGIFISGKDRVGNFYAEPAMLLTFYSTNTNDGMTDTNDINIRAYNTSHELTGTTTLPFDKVYNPSTGKRRTHHMIIDSEAKYAYYEDESLNHMVRGDWPVMDTDFLVFVIESSLVARVKFTPRWRSLV